MFGSRNDKNAPSIFKNSVRTLKSEELIKVSGGAFVGAHNKPSSIPDDSSGYFR